MDFSDIYAGKQTWFVLFPNSCDHIILISVNFNSVDRDFQLGKNHLTKTIGQYVHDAKLTDLLEHIIVAFVKDVYEEWITIVRGKFYLHLY